MTYTVVVLPLVSSLRMAPMGPPSWYGLMINPDSLSQDQKRFLKRRYDLDFDEDSILMQSLRLADGQPVYWTNAPTY